MPAKQRLPNIRVPSLTHILFLMADLFPSRGRVQGYDDV